MVKKNCLKNLISKVIENKWLGLTSNETLLKKKFRQVFPLNLML